MKAVKLIKVHTELRLCAWEVSFRMDVGVRIFSEKKSDAVVAQYFL